MSPLPILMYHSIADDVSSLFRRFAIPISRFAAQMAWLNRQGYTTYTVSQLVARRAEAVPIPEKAIVITFDDGFEDFYTAAYPIIQQYSLQVTLYLSTAYMGRTAEWLRAEGETERKMLHWDQVRALDNRFVEIGAHSHTHPALDRLKPDALRYEVQQCKDVIEAQLGRPCLSFAYPFGFYNAVCRQAVAGAGYTSACAVRYRLCTAQEDILALPRLIVPGNTSIETFEGIIEGKGAANSPLMQGRSWLWRQLRTFI